MRVRSDTNMRLSSVPTRRYLKLAETFVMTFTLHNNEI